MPKSSVCIAVANLVIALGAAVARAQNCQAPSRGGDVPVILRTCYDYVPTVLYEPDRARPYRMWWCGGLAGDFIFYSDGTGLDDPASWSVPVAVFGPSGTPGQFDAEHVCDPSVIRVGGAYYMYYSGCCSPAGGQPIPTKIALATSSDGINWNRANGGSPIVVPSLRHVSPDCGGPTPPPFGCYGAGQPSVVYRDGYFHMLYTDSTGEMADGQYLIRSTNPSFQFGVQEWIGSNWFPLATGQRPGAAYAVVEHAQSVDWGYAEVLNEFVVVINGNIGSIQFRSLDAQSFLPTRFVDVCGTWADGSGLVHVPNGSIPSGPACAELHLDVFRAVGVICANCAVDTSNLAHLGWNFSTGASPSCECVTGNVWVDFAYIEVEDGSFDRPFNSVAEGVAATELGGALAFRAGQTSETGRLSGRMTVLACGGLVRIGG